jgi:hypothetical protein
LILVFLARLIGLVGSRTGAVIRHDPPTTSIRPEPEYEDRAIERPSAPVSRHRSTLSSVTSGPHGAPTSSTTVPSGVLPSRFRVLPKRLHCFIEID